MSFYADFTETYWRKFAPRWKASTRKTHDLYRSNYLDRASDGMFLDEIERSHVETWFNRITDSGGPGATNRCAEMLRAMFNKAEAWGIMPEGSNPYVFVKMNKRRKCERFLSDREFERLGQALDARRTSHPLHCAAISMLMLTGCGKSEIINLTWSEVKGRRLFLTDSKTGPRMA